jgi:hypothetical protein
MGAKVNCKKGYNTREGFVEFKKLGEGELCPVSNAASCEGCQAKPFESEIRKKHINLGA